MTEKIKRKRGRPPKKRPAEKKIETEKPKVVPYPTGGRKISDFEQRQKLVLGDAEKPGITETLSPPAAEEKGLSEKIIQQAVKLPFDLWSISQNLDDLKLKDDEAALLSPAIKELLDHYAPKLPPIVIAWLTLGFGFYSILSVRLKLIAEIKKQKLGVVSPGSEGSMEGSRPAAPTDTAPTAGQAGFPNLRDIKQQAEQKI